MAKPELLIALSALIKKVDKLLEQQDKLRNRISELENTNLLLQQRLNEGLKDLDKAQKEVEFLTLSHRLANTPEALVSARNEVAKLIRTIDSCIRMLKED